MSYKAYKNKLILSSSEADIIEFTCLSKKSGFFVILLNFCRHIVKIFDNKKNIRRLSRPTTSMNYGAKQKETQKKWN